jgi:steroid 5-alpha reductase family enzyme
MEAQPTLARDERGINPLFPAVAAALIAAVVSGVVWGLIVKWSDYEIGIVAWGIGFIVAMAVATATRGSRGLPFQLVAIVFALLGILLGKYLSFVWVIQEMADEETGGAFDIPIFSRDTIDLFWAARADVFSWIDLLYAGLAIVTAWRVLAPEESEPERAQEREVEGPPITEQSERR